MFVQEYHIVSECVNIALRRFLDIKTISRQKEGNLHNFKFASLRVNSGYGPVFFCLCTSLKNQSAESAYFESKPEIEFQRDGYKILHFILTLNFCELFLRHDKKYKYTFHTLSSPHII